MRTLFDKIWDAHVVASRPGHPVVLYIDLHLIHEVTTPQAFDGLRRRSLKVRRPDRTLATMDHSTPTEPTLVRQVVEETGGPQRRFGPAGPLAIIDGQARRQLEVLHTNCLENGIRLFELGSEDNGIVHVIGPEQGRTLPGMTIVCGDSHTSTHGAFGALAFGIGTSEVEEVLATQCLLQRKPQPVEVRFEGPLASGATAKDMILALIAQIGTNGGNGCVFEYTGEAVRELDMDGRMTLCNMTIEAGARAGMVAPDEKTFAYLKDTPSAPKGREWDRLVESWEALRTDHGSAFSRTIEVDATSIAPMVTYGTNPGMAIPVDGVIPEPDSGADGDRVADALRYMDLEPGKPIEGQKINVAFLGSCTNSRMSDLRSAARILQNQKVAEGVRMLVVPGSARVKALAEAEGLDRIFLEAGAEWRAPGCSMCIAMNDDRLSPGMYSVSTSNRNFEGRQGPAGRTFLASPETTAASAIAGCISDPRRHMGGV